jgi:hypothetical protein
VASLREVLAGHIISCAIELDGREQYKLFFLAAHRRDDALCLKVTSVMRHFTPGSRRTAGVALCKAGEHAAFTTDSAIEPDNRFEIPYRRLGGEYLVNDRGAVSTTILDRLQTAIGKSVTINEAERKELRAALDAIQL